MKVRGRLAEFALTFAGCLILLLALVRGGRWALAAGAGAALAAFGLTLGAAVRAWRAERASTHPPTDFVHTLDLLRRAHAGSAAWAVGLRDGAVEVPEIPIASAGVRNRGGALVQLASVDGRTHVVRDPEGTYVAVGDFPYGAGLVLEEREASAARAEVASDDLRRLVAAMRLAELEVVADWGPLVARQLALIAAGAQTLEGVARAGAELAQQLTHHGAAVLIQDQTTLAVHVVATSTATDRRLEGVVLRPDAPAVRAIETGVPTIATGSEDVFGTGVPERRRQERAGTAYPLVDGHFGVGVLVVLGPAIRLETPLAEQVGRLVMELGPRLAAARAVQQAEQRAVRDPLTGLANRREMERQRDSFVTRQHDRMLPEPATMVYVDLDHFKRLNDTYGHAAGDSALRHIAGVLERQIRDGDVVARIGGEEFAVWLPRTPLEEGLEVAERIRAAIETEQWRWNGTPIALTASCGVAGYPESVADVANLNVAADTALYRAKQNGRNRVEKAKASG